jgi:excinuclease ABC subunit B
LGHNKQSGGFREAPQQKLEGYEQIPTADELRRLKDGQSGSHVEPAGDAQDPDQNKAFDPITGQPLSEALRARPDPAAGKKLADARKAEAEEQMKRIAEGATTRPRDGLEHLRPDLEDLPRPAVFVPHRPERPEKSEAGIPLKIVSDFEPRGDQPTAIAELVQGINEMPSATRCCSASPAPARPSPWPTSSRPPSARR